MKVLITGGAGFIGSTIASACADNGVESVILDNLVTGRAEFTDGHRFYRGDIADGALLDQIFADHPEIEATVHCAALIVVPESVSDPLRYWHANVAKTIAFVQHLLRNGRPRLLFSSTAAMYGPGDDFAVDEESAIEPGSPYARTKAAVEVMLQDVAAATELRALSLRYFNPIGADPQLRTGLQTPRPTHLLGKLIEASETGAEFAITGTDWPTRDGTGIRDFIHVWDLAAAHLAGLRSFDEVVPKDGSGYQVINLGTGTGTTVREMLVGYEQVTGESLRTRETGPRLGDVAGAYTRSDRARRLLGWTPEHSLADGIRDSLRWAEVRAERLG
ncbi:UDP-glucose 4-epimerase GalE [Natronosporangium hydrolyticum]|uniref:UDP-glucose 4-epimerase n=1 Tax=Natronosporangium hydrolyticum TaxID=2811111 RepID=A0A895YJG3_9ACTN|nr:UDP-glucose 4-epimerase GalE [Natronosporangium hydrolyticum]QSB14260.1 UDP-glucose 4-epimerase GalE [Natronosporangium hydrolyticum]